MSVPSMTMSTIAAIASAGDLARADDLTARSAAISDEKSTVTPSIGVSVKWSITRDLDLVGQLEAGHGEEHVDQGGAAVFGDRADAGRHVEQFLAERELLGLCIELGACGFQLGRGHQAELLGLVELRLRGVELRLTVGELLRLGVTLGFGGERVDDRVDVPRCRPRPRRGR